MLPGQCNPMSIVDAGAKEGCNPPETLQSSHQMYEQLTMLWIEYIDNYLVKKWLDSLPIEEWFYGVDLVPPHWQAQEVVPHVLVTEMQQC